jgi:DNA-binding CsgD family transcriptional regulator
MSHKESGRRLRVFLCHSSGDKEAVRQLYRRLHSDWIEPWFDEESLLPGHDWRREITKAIRGVDVVIVCLSPDSTGKAGFIHKEISYALDVAEEQPEGTIFLIPVKLEECDIPDNLARWHYVNLFEERGYERLMKALQQRAMALGVLAESLQTGGPASGKDEAAPAFELDAAEQGLVRLVAQGLTDEQIAFRLSVSETNVRHRLAHVFGKLGVSDRFGLIIYAYQHALVGPADVNRTILHPAGQRTGLLIPDGTDFADELGELARGAGFDVKSLPPALAHNQLEIIGSTDLSPSYELVILVRGEDYSQAGRERELFYSKLKQFVFDGGKLFATPWVGWENKYHEALNDALPFEHVMDTYNENKRVTCIPAAGELPERLFPEEFSFTSTFELLRPKTDSVVLCEMKDKIPFFGYKPFGAGVCYYLNTCQHYCAGAMASPLNSEALAACLRRVFKWVYGQGDGHLDV